MYRIQKREFSSNVLEKKHTIKGKEKWVVFIAPLEEKKKGDDECERLLDFYSHLKPYKQHAIIKTTEKIKNIPKGSIGTIVYVYRYCQAFEVEFIINGKSVVETLLINQTITHEIPNQLYRINCRTY